MKVPIDLYFKPEFPAALGERLELGRSASRKEIRAWCVSILFQVSQDVLDHPAPMVVMDGPTLTEPKAEDFKANDDRVSIFKPMKPDAEP